jgi:hypothetical protein
MAEWTVIMVQDESIGFVRGTAFRPRNYYANPFIECSEIAGKTVRSLRLYEDPKEGSEVVVDFTEGTTFSSSMEHKSTMKIESLRA